MELVGGDWCCGGTHLCRRDRGLALGAHVLVFLTLLNLALGAHVLVFLTLLNRVFPSSHKARSSELSAAKPRSRDCIRSLAPAPPRRRTESLPRATMLSLYCSKEHEVPYELPEESKKKLHALTHAWPPAIDPNCCVNQREVDAVMELRAALADIEEDCRFTSLDVRDVRILLCYCRARKLNIKKAEAMWRVSYEWRKEHQPDVTVKGFVVPDAMDRFGTSGPHGLDKDGACVYIDPIGKIDPAILKFCTVNDFKEVEMVKMEYHQRYCDLRTLATGKIQMGATVIIDLRGLGSHHFNQACIQALGAILQQSDAHYPERAKRVFVVYAPFIFWAIWAVVKLFLDETTRAKIQIHNDGGLETLLKYIDRDQLSAHLGGDLGKGTNCSPPIRLGGKIPKSYKGDEYFDPLEE